jgi:Flp pilus assembly protein TadB
MMGIYQKLIYLAPSNYRERIKKEIIFAGMNEKILNKFLGFAILFSFFLFFAVSFDLYLLGLGYFSFLIGLGVGVLLFVIINAVIILVADSRGREIEELLPDVLQLISANVRAGMTIDKAIWLSARPEFGLLEEEIRRVGAKTMGGKPIAKALTEMSERIKSVILDRTVKLIIEGIQSGGELGKLLDETATNVRTTQALRKEIHASVMMYTLFIVFAAVLGAPLLFAISIYFVEVISSLFVQQAVPTAFAGGGPFGGFMAGGSGGIQITPDQLFYFSLTVIALTNIFGALLIGLIQHGQEKRGLKFIPVLLIGALGVFFASRLLLSILLGGLFLR